MGSISTNLFSYLSSEYGQDAFLCWLLSWAAEGTESDPVLTACAKQMLKVFEPLLEGRDFHVVDVSRQWQHMDVVVTVQADRIYRIVIEDKTNTSQHDSQLERYMATLAEAYPEDVHTGVYYKTGFQSNLADVESAGYKIVQLPAIIEALQPFADKTDNAILRDYYSHWNDVLEHRLKFRTLSPADWDADQIQAFYEHLAGSSFAGDRGAGIGYGYVANQSGGFYGEWIWKHDDRLNVKGADLELYLQIEPYLNPATGTMEYPICLKISLQSELPAGLHRRDIRKAVSEDDQGRYRLSDYFFQRPARFGSGRTMTIGFISPAADSAAELETALTDAFEHYDDLLQQLKQEQA